MALYCFTVWPLASKCTFFKYPSSWSERINRFKMAAIIRFDLDISKMTVQGGGCTTVVMQNEIQIHQQKRRKALSIPLQAIISMMNNHNLDLFLCHPAVLGSRNLAICFHSQLFYSHFDIVKI